MKKKIFIILLIVFIIIFIISSGLLIYNLVSLESEKKANKELLELIIEDTNDDITDNTNGELLENGMLKKYSKLYKKNNDMAGWLYIEGTNINYPVMYTPNDIEYYLRRGFNKKYAFSGSLFLGEGWSREKNYAIIYGHHMDNNTMFAELYNYRKKKFGIKHLNIQFDTLYELNTYEVIGVFYSKIYKKNETNGFKYYEYTDLTDENTFNKYIKLVKNNSLYDTGVDAVYGDKILVLSTCSYHTENGRFVVVARKR